MWISQTFYGAGSVAGEKCGTATLLQETKDKLTTLENNIAKAQASEEEIFEVATMWRDDVFGMMQSLRETVDTIEELVDDSYWPIPTYVDLLFGI